jgi:hypothetical protein
MNCDELTFEQVEAVRHRVIRRARYLDRLRQRMLANRFPATDPLFTATCEAIHALDRLLKLLSDLADRQAPPALISPTPKLKPLPRRKRTNKRAKS